MAQHSPFEYHKADELQHIELIWQRDSNMFNDLDALSQHGSSVRSLIDHSDSALINEYDLVDVHRNDAAVNESFNSDIDLPERNSAYLSWDMPDIAASAIQELPIPSREEDLPESLPASQQSNASTEPDVDCTADRPTRTEEVEAVFVDLGYDEAPFFVVDGNLYQGTNAAVTNDAVDWESLVAQEMFACIGAWAFE